MTKRNYTRYGASLFQITEFCGRPQGHVRTRLMFRPRRASRINQRTVNERPIPLDVTALIYARQYATRTNNHQLTLQFDARDLYDTNRFPDVRSESPCVRTVVFCNLHRSRVAIYWPRAISEV